MCTYTRTMILLYLQKLIFSKLLLQGNVSPEFLKNVVLILITNNTNTYY